MLSRFWFNPILSVRGAAAAAAAAAAAPSTKVPADGGLGGAGLLHGLRHVLICPHVTFIV